MNNLNDPMNESVLCVPSESLARRGIGEGFMRFHTPISLLVDGEGAIMGKASMNRLGPARIVFDALHYVRRGQAETDEAFRQLIPYCLILDQGSLPYVYRRKGGAESRLEGNLSIGFGGHVDIGDAGGRMGLDGMATALVRELNEETGLRPDDYGRTIGWFGVINDTSNSVGRVHLGLVASICPVPSASVVLSVKHREGGFLDRTDILESLKDFEMWSKLILKDVYRIDA